MPSTTPTVIRERAANVLEQLADAADAGADAAAVCPADVDEIIAALRTREEVPEIAAAELVTGETFTHTGVLVVRIRSTTGSCARDALAQAAHAALESSPRIVRIEGTSVARNPAPKRQR